MTQLPWLTRTLRFPDPSEALSDPNGLLAAGGDLRPERLIQAYRQGIFPWYETGQPILWWTPDPRFVLFPEQLHVSRSLRKLLRKNPFRVTIDRAFNAVLQQCAGPRNYADGTWLTPEMQRAYGLMHELGFAHSIEAWQGEELVGGLYGIAMGGIFFGESMFSRSANASKVAFVHLVQHLITYDYKLIDCQVYSEHLKSLGAEEIPRQEFQQQLQLGLAHQCPNLAATELSWLDTTAT